MPAAEVAALPLALQDTRVNKLDTWAFNPKNALMFFPEGQELTAAEEIAAAGRKAEIKHGNTRFKGTPYPDTLATPATSSTTTTEIGGPKGPIAAPALPAAGFVDGSDSPKINGYGFVVTPSPSSAADPLSAGTWGIVGGTPFRLDGGDLPRAPDGPAFIIPKPSHREELGQRMEDEARVKRKLRDRVAGPAPSAAATPSQRLAAMSPAAQRLGRGLLARHPAFNDALRQSYSPAATGSRSRASRTPILTPLSTPRSTPQTSRSTITTHPTATDASRPAIASGKGSVTDNLLF